jgi:spore maturation protein CgeB
MKILYLTPNYSEYTASLYQFNTYKYISQKIKTYLWGPGFLEYNPDLNFNEVLKKFNIGINDVVCVGHGWLSDIELTKEDNTNIRSGYQGYSWLNKEKNKLNLSKLEFCNEYNFNLFKGKKVCILNKEYVSLDEKLKFIKKNNFDLVLCLNPNFKIYEKQTGVTFKFWPNAVDHNLYIKRNYKKKIDFCFSGLLKNNNNYLTQGKSANLRTKIFNRIFYNLNGIKIFKRKNYKDIKIFWNSFTGKKYFDFFLKKIKVYKYLTHDEYVNLLCESKVVLNTLGPSELIGPRYFESMMAKSICFAEESHHNSLLFKDCINYISFSKDLDDFKEKLDFALSDSDEIKKIINNAYSFVLNYHTYEKRAENFINWCNEIKTI